MLRFEKICKKFNPGTPDEAVVFQNFSLEMQRGEFLSIVGSNGSGKTTISTSSVGASRRIAGASCSPGRIFPGKRSIGAAPKWAASFRIPPGASAQA